MRLEGWHLVIIIALAVLLFGAPKLPGLARSVGQSLRIFKSEVRQLKDENNADAAQPRPDSSPATPGTHTAGSIRPTDNTLAPEAQPGAGTPHHSAGGETGGSGAGTDGSTPGKP